jgi:hypothetical protein
MLCRVLKESRRSFTDAIVKYALDDNYNDNSIRNNIRVVSYFSKFHFVISILSSRTYVLCIYIYIYIYVHTNNNGCIKIIIYLYDTGVTWTGTAEPKSF